MIKFLDLKTQYESIKTEINESIMEVIESESFVLGKYVDRFESNIANYIGVNKENVVSCASGSDALLLCLMSLGIKEGDEVITTPFTFIATASCVTRLGAKVVFVDIDQELNIDPYLVEKSFTAKTKAVISVDLYGKPCDQIQLQLICKKYNIAYISDSSQSIGSTILNSKVGSISNFTTFSFFPSKNLGCYGDGGLVIALDTKQAELIRQLRTHGSSKNNKYSYDYIGINSRLDAIQANVLNAKLKYLDSWIKTRRKNAVKYKQNLDTLYNNPQSDEGHVYHQYTICVDNRNILQEYLKNNGVSSMVYYPEPLSYQSCFKNHMIVKHKLVNSENYAQKVLSIPIHENLEEHNIDFIVKLINSYLK
jgi:UDP-2-acetamido-2-deoxy-ribo-hexuluronate aminotransferase